MIDFCSPDLLRLLVERTPSAVAVLDRRMQYLAANDRHLMAYGLVGEVDVLGVSHYDLVSAGQESWRHCAQRCLEEGADCCSGETLLSSESDDGSVQRQLCWEMHPWRGTDGEIAGVAVFTDAFTMDAAAPPQCASDRLRETEAEVRRARDELAAARAEVLEASRIKSSFLATMSHELRTPLASILLFCEMLYEDAVADGNRALADDLARVVGAGQQLRGLIDDLLDFAKLEAGRSRVEAAPFDVAELVRKTVSSIRPLAEKTGNTIEVNCPDDIGVMVSDPAKLRQSLMNLLSNACKFTENGRITLEVSRSKGPHGDEWMVFRVLDTGIGISKEVLPRLFRDFVQGDPSLTRKYGGTGLGLAVTRRYVEMMGGTVAAESEPGQGAVFTIRLPVELPQAA